MAPITGLAVEIWTVDGVSKREREESARKKETRERGRESKRGGWGERETWGERAQKLPETQASAFGCNYSARPMVDKCTSTLLSRDDIFLPALPQKTDG